MAESRNEKLLSIKNLKAWYTGNKNVLKVCAAQSAIFSVLLEWFMPIRNWKIENDLWNHPRKYIIPAVMLVIAGIVGPFPVVVYGLLAVLVFESAYLLYSLR